MAGRYSSTCPRCGTVFGPHAIEASSDHAIVGLGTERATEYQVVECRCGYLIFVGLESDGGTAPGLAERALSLASRFA